MGATIFVLVFVAALVWACVALLRSSKKQQRARQGPADMRRADDAELEAPYSNQKGYRAAQDTANWWSGQP